MTFRFQHAFKHTVAKYARDNVSVKQLFHYAQLQNSERFEMYDYGYRKNWMLYGSTVPPAYNLSASSVPLMIAYGTKDSLTKPQVKLPTLLLGNSFTEFSHSNTRILNY